MSLPSEQKTKCATRAIKNLHQLTKMGFKGEVDFEVLSRLHRLDPSSKEVKAHKGLSEVLSGSKLAAPGTRSMDPLFNGTVFLVKVTFNNVGATRGSVAISDADMNTALNYASLAAPKISQYSSQYGPNSIAVSPTVLPYTVDLQGSTSFDTAADDATLRGWVNAIVQTNSLPSNSCIVILCPRYNTAPAPQGIVNNYYSGAFGYHKKANVPYCFVNVYAQNLNIADTTNSYSDTLSHEIAEMCVDPNVDGLNPEVCDSCGANCGLNLSNFYDAQGDYINTAVFPPKFAYIFKICSIVKPGFASQCPPQNSACVYSSDLIGWDSLSGGLTSPPVAIRNADGRLEVFVKGTDNALWHIWQTTPNGGWSGWASLGGGLNSDPAVARNLDGRLEVFVVGTDGALWHIWQTAPNNGWSGWASLGGGLVGDLAAVSNVDGRLEVFGRGTDNALWHIWQLFTPAFPPWNPPTITWSGWASLAGVLTSPPSAIRNADGRVEVFVRGTDNALWHIWQQFHPVFPPWNPPTITWSGWSSLGGVLKGFPITGRNIDGRLEIFVRGTDDALWHIWQTAPNDGWSNWDSLGGILTSDPAVGNNLDMRLEVFVLGVNGYAYHVWQIFKYGLPWNPPAISWSGWAGLGGPFTSNPDVANNADGRLEVFTVGPNTDLWHIWQTAPNNGWNV